MRVSPILECTLNLITAAEAQFPAHHRSSVLEVIHFLLTKTAPPNPKSTPNSKSYLASSTS
jgi:hypothetical protein